jgi:hypothetical protein
MEYDDDDAAYDAWKDEQDDCIFDDNSPAFPDDERPSKWIFVKRDAAYWDSDEAPF